MSQDFSDPYRPPDIQQVPPSSADGEALRNVAFWQRFFSILGYLISALVILFVPLQFIAAFLSQSGGSPAVAGTLIGIIFALALTVMVYLIPAILLAGAAKATRELSNGRISIGEYAAKQKLFWRYLGIAVSIILLLYLTVIVVAVVVGIVFASASF